MGLLFVIVLSCVTAAMIFFFGYQDWVLIVACMLWLAALVVSLLHGHQGFGGRGNTDLQMVIAGLFIATVIIIPGYVAQKHCDQAKTALAELAKAEAGYFAGNKAYTTRLNFLNLKPDPNVEIRIIKADAQSFTATALHRLCNKETGGTPKIFLWDSTRGGLQQ